MRAKPVVSDLLEIDSDPAKCATPKSMLERQDLRRSTYGTSFAEFALAFAAVKRKIDRVILLEDLRALLFSRRAPVSFQNARALN
jgi:hypothetical protein